MKRFFVLFLALVLTACATATPPVTRTSPDATDELVMTTDEAPATVETETPAPVLESTATPTLLSIGGGGKFTSFVRSNDSFSLKCSPSEIIFGVKSLDATITKALFFYRVVDKSSAAPAGAMVNSKEMVSGDNGDFTLEFKTADLDEDLRYANGWFEYQIVGLNKDNAIVGRSEKVVKQVTFTIACP